MCVCVCASVYVCVCVGQLEFASPELLKEKGIDRDTVGELQWVYVSMQPHCYAWACTAFVCAQTHHTVCVCVCVCADTTSVRDFLIPIDEVVRRFWETDHGKAMQVRIHAGCVCVCVCIICLCVCPSVFYPGAKGALSMLDCVCVCVYVCPLLYTGSHRRAIR